jgi:hypothetical protein
MYRMSSSKKTPSSKKSSSRKSSSQSKKKPVKLLLKLKNIEDIKNRKTFETIEFESGVTVFDIKKELIKRILSKLGEFRHVAEIEIFKYDDAAKRIVLSNHEQMHDDKDFFFYNVKMLGGSSKSKKTRARKSRKSQTRRSH